MNRKKLRPEDISFGIRQAALRAYGPQAIFDAQIKKCGAEWTIKGRNINTTAKHRITYKRDGRQLLITFDDGQTIEYETEEA